MSNHVAEIGIHKLNGIPFIDMVVYDCSGREVVSFIRISGIVEVTSYRFRMSFYEKMEFKDNECFNGCVCVRCGQTVMDYPQLKTVNNLEKSQDVGGLTQYLKEQGFSVVILKTKEPYRYDK